MMLTVSLIFDFNLNLFATPDAMLDNLKDIDLNTDLNQANLIEPRIQEEANGKYFSHNPMEKHAQSTFAPASLDDNQQNDLPYG